MTKNLLKIIMLSGLSLIPQGPTKDNIKLEIPFEENYNNNSQKENYEKQIKELNKELNHTKEHQSIIKKRLNGDESYSTREEYKKFYVQKNYELEKERIILDKKIDSLSKLYLKNN